MGPMTVFGGFALPDGAVAQCDAAIEHACRNAGFPPGEEFKWSPDRGSWMREHLVEGDREEFFLKVVEVLQLLEATAVVVAADVTKGFAESSSASHEEDVISLFLERINSLAIETGAYVTVVFDEPGGGGRNRREHARFLTELLRGGTTYSQLERLPVPPALNESKHLRLLQAADLVVSCSGSYLSGEDRYSPTIFEQLLPLFRRGPHGINGYGFKIHPDYVYGNLYHWLLRDVDLHQGDGLLPLPIAGRPYPHAPYRYRGPQPLSEGTIYSSD